MYLCILRPSILMYMVFNTSVEDTSLLRVFLRAACSLHLTLINGRQQLRAGRAV